MKKRLILLFPLVFMSLIVSCDIASPYIDAILVKIDEDSEGGGGDADPEVAKVGNFSAVATALDLGVSSSIQLTWDDAVATDNQTEAVEIIIRVKQDTNPTGPADGEEVYIGSALLSEYIFSDFMIGALYHFGIWTKDASAYISEGQFDSASIQIAYYKASLDAYTDPYQSASGPIFSPAELYAGSDGVNLHSYINFPSVDVENVLQAFFSIGIQSPGNVIAVDIGRISQNWNTSSTFDDLFYGSYVDIGSWNSDTSPIFMDITTTVEYWKNNSCYGLRLFDNEGEYRAVLNSLQDFVNYPELKVYYGSD
ncbi:hypothetical protein [Spirochaeta isovalerica]|uniref:SbsA Ig-like domain-containing protein n=1 Tax=Spirochaeta isovalerica TaxID=150 RepID=A0A841RCD0_9SPIO|nr:hypothetical protein [Spirochaeta isovalerica]MBB6481645.1 hypothetical protein [Spirochaeta isovalerica]